ncbi:hypothetical protein [Arenimonas sp. GDDSR-1]|uniref:hypothetical protein n=1 Tax=Arenimonas sp. GDDSR-1 TaxID=2950125 RepID=UPI002623784E|nr:hypothetical protein [Arenimonas sp. GDDSR-1]
MHDRGSLSPCNGKQPAWDIKPTPVFSGPQALFYPLDFAEFSKRLWTDYGKSGFFRFNSLAYCMPPDGMNPQTPDLPLISG